MSRIEQLIKKLCPNGVNKKSLGEIGQIIVGGEAPNDCIKGSLIEARRCLPALPGIPGGNHYRTQW